jgi:hypothetical protein
MVREEFSREGPGQPERGAAVRPARPVAGIEKERRPLFFSLNDFIDGCLGGFDQAQHRQQKLPFLLEQFGQSPAVCAVDDLVV